MQRLFSTTLLVVLTAAPAVAQFGSFGISASVYGNEVLVSRPIGEGPGMIFVFNQDDDGVWQRTDTIMAAEPADEDFFGYFMKVHAGQLFVGAPSQDTSQGVIHVLERAADTGDIIHVESIVGSEEDRIGASVHFFGAEVYSGGVSDGSHVTVFTRGEDAWERTGIVTMDGIGEGDAFGTSLAMSNASLFVGAPGALDGAGVVHIFSREDGSYQAMLSASDTTLIGFGGSLHFLDSGMLLVGAPGIGPNSQPTAPPPPGAVIVFTPGEEGSWTESQTLSLRPTERYDFFGRAILSYESDVLISAPLAEEFQGRVIRYSQNDDDQWHGTDTISAEGTVTFGLAMALEGDVLVITAPAARSGIGAAYVFRASDDGWQQEGSVDSGAEPPEPETAGIDMVPSDGPSECADSLAWQFGCSNVDLLAFLPISAIGGGEGVTASDIWGWTDPDSGIEYALLGRSDGTAFIDIGDPTNPVYLGSLAMTEGARAAVWRDIKVFNNHAFIVADGAGEHGMQVFDLMQLRDVESPPVAYEATAHYAGIASAHNIVINEDTGFAYAVGARGGGEGCGGGLHMINIQDPLNPTFAGCFAHEGTGRSGTGYSHDAQCVIYHGPDEDYLGKEICLGSNETALSIADVTDKENPVALSSADYPNVSYAHQGWLTDDHRYFYMNDELDELGGEVVGTRTLIWDLMDLDDPTLVTEYKSENLSSDHNLYIRGDVMYQSNYKSGLRIFDITDRANPTVVGFFDTFPAGDDDPGFAGSWSNYPYFDSGTIIVSSMGEGLFILKRQALDI